MTKSAVNMPNIATYSQTQGMRIVIVNAKGGCGKSTLATNLASYYATQGISTALFDYDKQASSSAWLRLRQSKGQRPLVQGVSCNRQLGEEQKVTRAWQLRNPQGVERIIVDTPAAMSKPDTREVLRQAQILLVPVLPSPIDMEAIGEFIQELKHCADLINPQLQCGIIANRTKKNTLVYKALMEFLQTLPYATVAKLRETQNYTKAAMSGLGIFELEENNAKDKAEWRPLIEWLEGEARQGILEFPRQNQNRVAAVI